MIGVSLQIYCHFFIACQIFEEAFNILLAMAVLR